MIKIRLDMLNEHHVSVLSEVFDEEGYIVRNHRTTYVNDNKGRQLVQEVIPEPYRTAILTVWGDVPVIVEDGN